MCLVLRLTSSLALNPLSIDLRPQVICPIANIRARRVNMGSDRTSDVIFQALWMQSIGLRSGAGDKATINVGNKTLDSRSDWRVRQSQRSYLSPERSNFARNILVRTGPTFEPEALQTGPFESVYSEQAGLVNFNPTRVKSSLAF